MESIRCIQGQVEGSRGPPVLVPITEGISQDVLQSFMVQESQGEDHPLCQEIGLVTVMFFFELFFYFPMFSCSISLYVFFHNLFSITHLLICFLLETLKTKDIKKGVYLVSGKV